MQAYGNFDFAAGCEPQRLEIYTGINKLAECRRMGISILPPDVNHSGLKFIPESTNGTMAIRYGLAAIKHVGESAMEMSIREREGGGGFTSLDDFCGRLGSRIANRKMLESLVKSGAFDFLGRERAELFACIDDALVSSAAAHRDRAAGQVSLFDEIAASITSTPRKLVAPV